MAVIGRYGNMRVAKNKDGQFVGYAPIERKTVEVRGVNGAIGNRPPTAKREMQRVWIADPITGETNGRVEEVEVWR